MSLCESNGVNLRGSLCKRCPSGKRSYVEKVVNQIDIENSKDHRVSNIAGRVWLIEGAGQSTKEEEKADYAKALSIIARRVCKKMGRLYLPDDL